jgi:hypothetical protein
MAAHEAPAAVHDHIAADYARRRALQLCDQFEAAQNGTAPMDDAEWAGWEGAAHAILKELARG